MIISFLLLLIVFLEKASESHEACNSFGAAALSLQKAAEISKVKYFNIFTFLFSFFIVIVIVVVVSNLEDLNKQQRFMFEPHKFGGYVVKLFVLVSFYVRLQKR